MSVSQIAGESWRFLAVSIVGLVIDLGTALTLSALGLNLFLAASLGFALAVFVNYHLHRRWTFGGKTERSLLRLVQFFATSLVTLLVRLLALEGLIALALPVVVYRDGELLFLATGVSLVANFLMSKFIVFRAKPE
ncbi:MAG: GtrA family protein [Kiloniellales bacterium]